MPNLDKRCMHLSLRQLGELTGVQVEFGDDDREGFDQFLDAPLRLLARQFRNHTAFRVFVQRKLDQAQERRRLQNITAIFDRQDPPK